MNWTKRKPMIDPDETKHREMQDQGRTALGSSLCLCVQSRFGDVKRPPSDDLEELRRAREFEQPPHAIMNAGDLQARATVPHGFLQSQHQPQLPAADGR